MKISNSLPKCAQKMGCQSNSMAKPDIDSKMVFWVLARIQ